jgi:hypothetical protein
VPHLSCWRFGNVLRAEGSVLPALWEVRMTPPATPHLSGAEQKLRRNIWSSRSDSHATSFPPPPPPPPWSRGRRGGKGEAMGIISQEVRPPPSYHIIHIYWGRPVLIWNSPSRTKLLNNTNCLHTTHMYYSFLFSYENLQMKQSFSIRTLDEYEITNHKCYSLLLHDSHTTIPSNIL